MRHVLLVVSLVCASVVGAGVAAAEAPAEVAIRPALPEEAEPVGSVPMHAPGETIPAGATDNHPIANHGASDLTPEHHSAAHDGGHGGGHGDPSKHFNFFDGVPFGYTSMDIEGGPLGDGKLGTGEHARPLAPGEPEEGMSAPFIGMLFNFAVLLILLYWKAGPIATTAARERSEQIESALEEAAKLRAAAQAKLDEYGAKLAAADAEITKMVEGMRADAEAEKARVLAAADAQAAAMKRDADERIAAEIARARALLTREVTSAAARAAEQLVRDRATAADQTRLVDGFIADLAAAPKPSSKEQR
ncbi:MAG: hypothetical protein R2939_15665 [Kofleriaceae bacterium]